MPDDSGRPDLAELAEERAHERYEHEHIEGGEPPPIVTIRGLHYQDETGMHYLAGGLADAPDGTMLVKTTVGGEPALVFEDPVEAGGIPSSEIDAASGVAKLGSDKKVGGPGGSALSASVVSGSPAGGAQVWKAATAYIVNELVTSSEVTYVCLKAHISGETFSGLGTNWAVLAGAAVESVSILPSGGDDTSILQVAANSFGEVRLQRSATYRLTSNAGLVIDPSKCRFKGAATVIGCGSMTAGAAVTFKGSTNSYTDASSGGWEGITLTGPGIGSVVKGIAFAGESAAEATALFSCRDSTVHDFGVGVSEESNAYAISVYGLSVYNCGKIIDNSLATANAGERMTYIGCTFFNSTLALNLQGTEGSHHFVACSFDFSTQLVALKGPHRCFMQNCHIEYASSTTVPIQLTGANPIFEMTGGELYVHVQTVLTTELASGVAVTELKVLRVEAAITSGDTIRVITGTNVDTFTASANAAVGATSIVVASHVPANVHPATTSRVIDSTILPSAIVSNSAPIEHNSGAYFTGVPMEGIITSSGNFVEGGTQNQTCFVLPNMADGTCINPTTGNPTNMPSALPAGTSVMGSLYGNTKLDTVSTSTFALTPSLGNLEVLTVTTASAVTLSLTGGSTPANTQTQRYTLIIFNNSGGALGTITFPGGWNWAGYTFTAPATGKRRAIDTVYDSSTGKFTVVGFSPADY